MFPVVGTGVGCALGGLTGASVAPGTAAMTYLDKVCSDNNSE